MKKQHWLARRETIRSLWIVFALVLAATVIAELFVAQEAHFDVERIFGFNAWFGLLACAGMITVAKLLGVVLKRPDTYYEGGDD
ncbi:MAG: hypothetical protein A3G24_20735 [Betaproteobacteria bacterium RIFCSPLOWO2_12_FULL_62_13]|nr:MAG: hypothetical protein A3G24_20735 [Betaproteobacteria bacterium RIFCSPLOWO2_12_FULL_62_13]